LEKNLGRERVRHGLTPGIGVAGIIGGLAAHEELFMAIITPQIIRRNEIRVVIV